MGIAIECLKGSVWGLWSSPCPRAHPLLAWGGGKAVRDGQWKTLASWCRDTLIFEHVSMPFTPTCLFFLLLLSAVGKSLWDSESSPVAAGLLDLCYSVPHGCTGDPRYSAGDWEFSDTLPLLKPLLLISLAWTGKILWQLWGLNCFYPGLNSSDGNLRTQFYSF